jgi:hypothetical protein
MICSRRHGFLFLKTTKTAGTSVELGLAGICGPEDVITRLTPQDEVLRRQLGVPGPQNDRFPLSAWRAGDLWRFLREGHKKKFYNHIGAAEARTLLGEAGWGSSFKFAIERNPWDRLLSFFHWQQSRNAAETLESFVARGAVERMHERGWGLYTVGERLAVDRVIRFEALDQELARIAAELGFAPVVLPRAKSGLRSDRRPYQEVLGADVRDRVARICAPEIEMMDYRFD